MQVHGEQEGCFLQTMNIGCVIVFMTVGLVVLLVIVAAIGQ